MDFNYGNVPKALLYFFIGALANLLIYYIFAPTQGDVLNILLGIFDTSGTFAFAGTIWIAIMIVALMVNLVVPVWCLFED